MPAFDFTAAQELVLDFAGAVGLDDILDNLSGIAVVGDLAFTVADEGRTVECLARSEHGFRLQAQYSLDRFFPELPGGHEADLEAITIASGRIWLCGSHCRVRLEPAEGERLATGFRRRPSRHLLGSVRIGPAGTLKKSSAAALPFTGAGSLRRQLRGNPFLSPFLELPSKENGLDIEGLAVLRERLLLGLRGPVVDSHAVIVSFAHDGAMPIDGQDPLLFFCDLHGLGIRDLYCRRDGTLLILAGPVTRADGPFRIYGAEAMSAADVMRPALLHEWPIGHEHPEGVCEFALDGRPGLLVVYDGASPRRRNGTQVSADWVPAS